MSAENETVNVIVEGNTLVCKKNVLKENSEYFRAMFDSNMIESRSSSVTLYDAKFSLVSNLIEFMKSGELNIGRGARNLKELTETAVMLQIPDAIESCSTYFQQTLGDENCLSLMSFAKSLSMETLFGVAKRHALFFFPRVRNCREFLELGRKQLEEYLAHPHINCESEREILEAICEWYEHDKTNRKMLLPELCKCFYAEDVLDSEWDGLMDHRLVKESADWKNFLENERKELKRARKHKDKFRNLPHLLLTIGGSINRQDEDVPCPDICKFDENEKTFVPALKLSDIFPELHFKMGYQVTVVGKDLYISGGQLTMKRSSMLTDVWKLDGFDLKWSKVTKLSSVRRHHGACGSETSLYIMGGFGKYRDVLDTVEEYSTTEDRWTKLPPMPFTWFTPDAVCCSGKLFVYKTHLISLDLATQEWTTIRSTPCPHDDLNTYIPHYFGGYIYEFPYLDLELDWFYEFELGKLQLRRTSPETGNWEPVEYDQDVNLGNRICCLGRKFYTIDRYNQDLFCGNFTDFKHLEKLGSLGEVAGREGFLVALPHLPLYKIKPCSDADQNIANSMSE